MDPAAGMVLVKMAVQLTRFEDVWITHALPTEPFNTN
jgi:hypothetical protein